MDSLKALMGPLASSPLADTVKLVVLGGTVETARRVSSSAWSSFINSFFLTAHFSEEDYPFDWLMLWLSKRPEWGRSREFETTTRTQTIGLSPNSPLPGEITDPDDPDLLQDAEEEAEGELAPGKQKMRVVFQPTFDTTHTIFYKGHWLRVKRWRKDNGSCEMLSISVVARSNSILKQLVLQAKKDYEADSIHRIQIFFADSHGSWRWTDSRHKRPMSSIVLDAGAKEMLLADTRDFLRSEKWYADRGIPFRRGYLLHGVPGSGKSSLIHAIAGELHLDIYVVSLSSSWINDATLTTLMGRVPARCILLLEDLDAAFTRSTARDATSTGKPSNKSDDEDNANGNNNGNNGKNAKEEKKEEDVNTLSLSGLLNALDGVAAAEGRILFATTNHLERLDPALSRPGRMDVWIEFRNASKWQAEQLFRNFFPSAQDPWTRSSSAPPSTSSPSDAELEKMEMPGLECTALESSASSSSGSSSAAPLTPSTSAASPRETMRKRTSSSSLLEPARLAFLAKQFSDAIPENEFSVAALQGYLLKNKSRPEAAAAEAASWVVSERELRERLQREKEEKERKEKLEKERRRRELQRDREEQERKERRLRDEEDRGRERSRERRREEDRKKDLEEARKSTQASPDDKPGESASAASAPVLPPPPAVAPPTIAPAPVAGEASTSAEAPKDASWVLTANEDAESTSTSA